MPSILQGVPEVHAALAQLSVRISTESRLAIAEAAATVESAAKQNASGRPGPNVITGTLRRSITHDPITPYGAGGWQTQVGPTVIYGRRVELGFSGADSRGRTFNQPGYPYFGTAVAATQSRVEAIFAARIAAAYSA
jgi:hypothetical protein